jgi:GT2 family glycosyltransferase
VSCTDADAEIRLLPTEVIVVAYGNPHELETCLAGLNRCAPITVVDNSSSEAVKDVAIRYGGHYINSGANIGFAAGVNLALRRMEAAPPDLVLLLNPDAVLTPSAHSALAEFLLSPGHERVAAVAPRLVEDDGRAQRVVWPFPTPLRAWVEAAGMGRLRSRQTFVIGAVVLLRWDAIREVGRFDERFFLYAEETDWMRRAVRAGWRTELCRDAVARHHGAGSSDDGLRREALFYAGQETYVRKWYGPIGWTTFRVGAGMGAGVRALLLSGPRRSEARRRFKLYLRGPRRCAGIV